jgi:DHA3 family macrolide efflux protein-like MFS transporter
VLLSAWGGPESKVRGLLVGQMLGAFFLAFIGLRPSMPLVAAALFLSMVIAPTAGSCSQAIWLSKTPPEMMGRVLAIRRMLAFSTMPVGALLCGPLADRVFNPLLMPGGALAGTGGRVVGVGPGRGIGLMFLLVSTLMIALTAALYAHPRVRRLEEEIPDAAPAHPAPAEPAEPEPMVAAGA